MLTCVAFSRKFFATPADGDVVKIIILQNWVEVCSKFPSTLLAKKNSLEPIVINIRVLPGGEQQRKCFDIVNGKALTQKRNKRSSTP